MTPTRNQCLAFLYESLNALPYFGPKGLDPSWRMVWRLHPQTLLRMGGPPAVWDPQNPEARLIGNVPVMSDETVAPDTLTLSLVRSSTQTSPQ